ncbi:MAG: hypothetical protein NTX52_14100, partial [Planctomycetota bacterium]|nr:hypothetical protein [Planctomycetota bacterium]
LDDISDFGAKLGNLPLSIGNIIAVGDAVNAGTAFQSAQSYFESEKEEWQKVLDNPKSMDPQRLLSLLDLEETWLEGKEGAIRYIALFESEVGNNDLEQFVEKTITTVTHMTDYIHTLQKVLQGEGKMRITTFCPVDLVITSPSGAVLSKTQNQILGATYNELDINGDLRMDDIAEIPVPISGKYAITVVPEDGASPTDIYALVVEKSGIPTVLAEDIQIQNIPESPYVTEGSVNISLAINKCKVTASKIQGQDVFEASGTFDSFPADINEVNQINIYIASLADAAIIYAETIDFNASSDVVKGKYSYKIPRGRKAGITSLAINFNKKTFAIKSKKINLTGLGCPLQLSIVMGNYILSGQVPESIVNGSKPIPTRLMRTYKNMLFVSKAKVRNSSKPSSDSLSVKGEIVVADINNSNLAIQDVNVVWGDHTFAIPAHSFKAVRSGNSYKCSGIATDGSDSLITANIDLDKCTFTILVKNADSLNVGPNEVVFGLRFVDFNESDEVNLALGY